MQFRSAGNSEGLQFDPEIERTARKLRKQAQRRKKKELQAKRMAETATNDGETATVEKTLAEYGVVNPDTCATSIVTPAVTAQNFEIKPAYIQLVQQSQFSGAPSEDPGEHIANFLTILDFFKIQGASEDAIRLRMFPMSLRDRAKGWLMSFPPGTFTTWEVLSRRFIDKYFPPAKQARLRQDINAFTQQDGESLHEAWERFSHMLRKCPNHALPDWMQIQLFYNGLRMSTRSMVDAAAGGALNSKTLTEAKELIERMAQNSSHSAPERGVVKKADLDISQVQALVVQNREMQQQIAALTKQLSLVQTTAAVSSSLACDFCGGNHKNGDCANESSGPSAEQVQFISGGQGGYNPGYKSHPNFSWRNSPHQPLQEQPPSWGPAFEKLATSTTAFIEEARANFKSQGASIRNLEIQVGQIAKQLHERSPGTFPSDTTNPKEQCNAIMLRSGTTLPEPQVKPTQEVSNPAPAVQSTLTKPAVQEKEQEKEKDPYFEVPFPQRLKKGATQRQFERFMETFRQLQINIPFAEALEQMPLYARFMKDLLSRKKKMMPEETVKLTEECSAILQRKLPQKLKDPGSFNLPCDIGGKYFSKALCDLGASVNLMPLNVFDKLGIEEVKPTTASLQLADRSILRPWGVVEDVLVKVDQFVLPMDFMIVDIPDNDLAGGFNVPLIFGRPFLATAGVIIDVPRGEVILRVNGEHATLKMFETPPPTADLFAPLMDNQHSTGESVGNGKTSKVAALWGSLRPP